MDKNKKIIIIFAAVIVLLVIVVTVIFFFSGKKASLNQPTTNPANTTQPTLPEPKFLDDTAKAKLGLPLSLKAQILQQDARGQVTVYKVIKTNQDIVADPSALGSLSPLLRSAAK
jgi:hypothetical protein